MKIDDQTPVSWQTFLAEKPPSSTCVVDCDYHLGPTVSGLLKHESVKLHCDSKECAGVHWFDSERSSQLGGAEREPQHGFLHYKCRHCKRTYKRIAVKVEYASGLYPGAGKVIMTKLGELPPFGPVVPSRLIALTGDDQDFFWKGRRAESMGLGIAAFAYYRRVVENQKNRLIDEFIKVATRIGKTELVPDLEKAKRETHFSSAIASVKAGIPEVLKINGHNPLTLLHKALSEGLHAETDKQCLELATAIRVVLTELAESVQQAMKDHAELQGAVTRLLNRAPAKKATKGGNKSSEQQAPTT